MRDEHSTMLHLLQHQATTKPGATAIVHEPAEANPYEVTYEQLWQRVGGAAAQISAKSEEGDRVVLLFPSGTDFVAAFLGSILSRRIAVPASIPRNERAVDRAMAIVRDSDASLIVTTPALMLKLQTMLGRVSVRNATVPAVIAVDSNVSGIGNDMVRCEAPDIAFLQYTSGSTSHPKGVMVTNENLIDNVGRIHDVFGFDETTQFINWLPVHHDMGLIGGILAPLAAGCSTVLMSPIEFIQRPIRWLELITRYRGNISGAPNFAYDACATRIPDEHLEGLDLSSWRVAFNGSEPIRAQTFERFARRFEPYGLDPRALFPCYGLAESTLLVAGKGKVEYRATTFDRSELKEHRAVVADNGRTLVGCGRPIDGHELAIVNPETKERCQKSGIGEVWVSGPSICRGYWSRQEETSSSFLAVLDGDASKDFLRTGDLGVMHEGQLYIAGRLKNIVIIRGLNYACEDIEDLSQGSDPAVAGAPCAAFGIDGPTGEQLVIAQEVNRAYLDSFNREEVTAAIQESVVLNHGVRATDVVLVRPRALPRTTSGKLQRPQARELYLGGKLPVASRTVVEDEELGAPTRARGGG